MGDSKKWGDRFAAWFLALPQGKKFAVSLVLASVVIVGPALTAQTLIPPGEATEPTKVQTACGGRTIEINRDDPIWDENDLQASVIRMCDRAWGRS